MNWGVWADVGMAADTLAGGGAVALPARAINAALLETAGSGDSGVPEFTTEIATSHWLLDQHRTLDGRAIMPGTGYIELLAEAAQAQGLQGFTLQDLYFLRPLPLVDGARRNARESLARKLAETATQTNLLKGIADAFDLPAPPQRIEVYDNSHIQGTNAVGGMIVAGPDGMMKNQYRKFNIRGDDLTPGDDFGMMKEVLTRRFKRLLKEDPDRKLGMWPDLLLIDGGAGQVSAVASIMREYGVEDIPMVGVAKGVDRDAGKEEFYRVGKRPMALRHNDPVLYFIQRLRDEAHRFAIGTHRAKRAKAVGATPLDDVPGVGAARKRALLAHFGSAKAVGRANLSDLKAVDGVSVALAERIYAFFHERG